jgi:PmbA protein
VRVYGNSHGFLQGFPSTSHSVSCVLLAQTGDDMQRDYWYASARDARELESSESIGRKAGERAVARLGARKIGTQKARVLYAPEVARGLIGHFLGAVRGSSQYRKSSFLLGASGQQIFPSFVQLVERPHILKALGSSPFDGEA